MSDWALLLFYCIRSPRKAMNWRTASRGVFDRKKNNKYKDLVVNDENRIAICSDMKTLNWLLIEIHIYIKYKKLVKEYDIPCPVCFV
jgi:hypothetical protein